LALLFLVTAPAWPQKSNAKYDPAVSSPAKPKQGLLDFTLRHINSTDRDYGFCIDQDRAFLLGQTIDNGYFWSNVVCLALMGCLFAGIVFQHKGNVEHGWKLAETIAQYKSALSCANGQVQAGIERNADLMQFASRLKEGSSPSSLPNSEELPKASTNNSQQPSSSRENFPPVPAKAARNAGKVSEGAPARSKPTVPPAQIGLFQVDGDIVMKVNTQEQQITALREQVTLLRGQLTESEQRLRAEQGKNRALKGA
jgi:hypothetical protein